MGGERSPIAARRVVEPIPPPRGAEDAVCWSPRAQHEVCTGERSYVPGDVGGPLKRLLFLGSRRLEIELGIQVRGEPGALAFDDRLRVLALLRRFAVEPANLAQLRGALAESALAGVVSRLDDAAVIEQLAALLVAGRLVLRDLPRTPRLTGVDGPVEDEPLAPSSARAPKAPLTWIEIQLIGEDDRPIPGEVYRIELPDGSVRQGTLDAKGLARVDRIEPGTCVVTFPRLDEEAWKRV